MRPELFAATVEREQDGVFIVEMNPKDLLRPRVVYANPAFFALTGFEPGDIAAGAYPRLLGPETNRALVVDCAQRVASGETVECEVRLYRKNRTPFWAAVRSHPLDDPAHYCVLMMRDVTERRVADDHCRLLSQALHEASDLVLITDASASSLREPPIVYANQAFLDATGYALNEIVGNSNLSFYSDENDPVVLSAMQQNIELGLRNEKEALVRRKDGSTFWIEVVGKPFVDANQEHSYRIVIGRDISLRKRSMNELTLLLGAAECLLDRIILYERTGSGEIAVIYENAAAVKFGRYRLLEMLTPGSSVESETYARLLRGEQLSQLMLEDHGPNTPEIHEFTARSIRSVGGSIEAVITVERRIEDIVYQQLMTFPRKAETKGPER